MEFKFKVGSKIKEAWPLYKDSFGLIILLMVVSVAVQMISSVPHGNRNNIILALLSVIAGILVSYIWIKASLNLIDGKGFNPFQKESLPSLSQFWDFIKTNILVVLCVIAGFILFIIPGLYVIGRLFPAKYISVEKSQGARKTIIEAWELTKDNGWYLFWKNFLVGLFVLAGFIAIFIGVIITYPIAIIVASMMYREIIKFKVTPTISSIPEVPKAEVAKEELKLEEKIEDKAGVGETKTEEVK